MAVSARSRTTSRRWAAMSWVVATAIAAVLVTSFWRAVGEYHESVDAATEAVFATVVESHAKIRGQDYIVIEWTGRDRLVHRDRFDLEDARAYPVGRTMAVLISPTSSGDAFAPWDETEQPSVAVWLYVAVVLTISGFWALRMIQWWRAARAPTRALRAHLMYSYGRQVPSRWQATGIPWLSIVDGDRTWYQRFMWEPWVEDLGDDLVVEARRAGRGAFVVDVPGAGRLWPASGARTRQPSAFESLTDHRPARHRLSRLATLALTVPVLVTALLVQVTEPFVSRWLFGLGFVSQLWLLVLYLGGPPAPIPWVRAEDRPPPRRAT